MLTSVNVFAVTKTTTPPPIFFWGGGGTSPGSALREKVIHRYGCQEAPDGQTAKLY